MRESARPLACVSIFLQNPNSTFLTLLYSLPRKELNLFFQNFHFPFVIVDARATRNALLFSSFKFSTFESTTAIGERGRRRKKKTEKPFFFFFFLEEPDQPRPTKTVICLFFSSLPSHHQLASPCILLQNRSRSTICSHSFLFNKPCGTTPRIKKLKKSGKFFPSPTRVPSLFTVFSPSFPTSSTTIHFYVPPKEERERKRKSVSPRRKENEKRSGGSASFLSTGGRARSLSSLTTSLPFSASFVLSLLAPSPPPPTPPLSFSARRNTAKPPATPPSTPHTR